MAMKGFALDIDGVLADTPARLAEISRAWFCVDFEVAQITTYQMTDVLPLNDSQLESMLTSADFYGGIIPMAGAAEFTAALFDAGWSVDLVTARPIGTWQTTVEWLRAHGFRWVTLTHSNNKTLWAKRHKPVYFVEDKFTTAFDLAPLVPEVFLIDWPYNQGPLPANVRRVGALGDILEWL